MYAIRITGHGSVGYLKGHDGMVVASEDYGTIRIQALDFANQSEDVLDIVYLAGAPGDTETVVENIPVVAREPEKKTLFDWMGEIRLGGIIVYASMIFCAVWVPYVLILLARFLSR